MIFANHAHIFPSEIKEKGAPELLIEQLDYCGIDKAVAFSPFLRQFEDSALYFDKDPIEWTAKIVSENSDRMVGFGTIDFDEKHMTITDQIEKMHSLGLKGIKIHPAYQKLQIDGIKAFKAYQKAQEKGMFLSFHTGLHWHRIKDYSMLLFDEVAYNFPTLRFSMEHMGGYTFFREALLIICNNKRAPIPHVYAGLTSVAMGENGLCGTWSLTDNEIETLIFQTGENMTIFGLDFPYNNSEYNKKAIDRIRNLNISDTAKANILGNTLAEILL